MKYVFSDSVSSPWFTCIVAEAREVTQTGVSYVPPMTPQRGNPTGHPVILHGVTVWLNGSKFTENPAGFTHLLLQVRSPGGVAENEMVTQNNYRALSVSISHLSSRGQL